MSVNTFLVLKFLGAAVPLVAVGVTVGEIFRNGIYGFETSPKNFRSQIDLDLLIEDDYLLDNFISKSVLQKGNEEDDVKKWGKFFELSKSHLNNWVSSVPDCSGSSESTKTKEELKKKTEELKTKIDDFSKKFSENKDGLSSKKDELFGKLPEIKKLYLEQNSERKKFKDSCKEV